MNEEHYILNDEIDIEDVEAEEDASEFQLPSDFNEVEHQDEYGAPPEEGELELEVGFDFNYC